MYQILCEVVKMNIVPAFKFFLKIRTYNHNPEMLHAIIALERGVVLRSVQLTHCKRCLGKSCSRWDICEVFLVCDE